MDTKRIAESFHHDGFIIVPEVFGTDELAEIEKHLQQYIEQVVPSLKTGDVYYEDGPGRAIKSVFRIHEQSDFFEQLMADPRLLALVQAIWPDGEVVPGGVMLFGKAARDGSVTPLHQDNVFQHWNPPLALTATVALDQSTPDNGALTCLARSHTIGLLPHRQSGVLGFSRCLIEPIDTAAYREVQLCMKPGDVAMHHVNVIHGSGANKTDQSRRQLGIGYSSSLAQVDKDAWDRYQQDLAELHEKAKSV